MGHVSPRAQISGEKEVEKDRKYRPAPFTSTKGLRDDGQQSETLTKSVMTRPDRRET